MTVAAFDKQWAKFEAAYAAIQEEIEACNVSSPLHDKLTARSHKIWERMEAFARKAGRAVYEDSDSFAYFCLPQWEDMVGE